VRRRGGGFCCEHAAKCRGGGLSLYQLCKGLTHHISRRGSSSRHSSHVAWHRADSKFCAHGLGKCDTVATEQVVLVSWPLAWTTQCMGWVGVTSRRGGSGGGGGGGDGGGGGGGGVCVCVCVMCVCVCVRARARMCACESTAHANTRRYSSFTRSHMCQGRSGLTLQSFDHREHLAFRQCCTAQRDSVVVLMHVTRGGLTPEHASARALRRTVRRARGKHWRVSATVTRAPPAKLARSYWLLCTTDGPSCGRLRIDARVSAQKLQAIDPPRSMNHRQKQDKIQHTKLDAHVI
jgi:hypothetical protein